MKDTVVIYPGSFDPITLGHLDIIERASKMFDTVIVAVGINQEKHCTFTVGERLKLIELSCKHLNNVQIEAFSGLLAEYAKEKGAIGVIKGLRALSDFDYEFQMSLTNRSLNEEFETILLPSRLDFMFLSSSMVRQIGKLNGDISKYIPKEILETVEDRLNSV